MTAASDFPGVTVRVDRGEFIDSAMRRFKKSVQKNGVLADARRHEHWVPRSERRRAKAVAARKRRA